jgi:hypothetical protein
LTINQVRRSNVFVACLSKVDQNVLALFDHVSSMMLDYGNKKEMTIFIKTEVSIMSIPTLSDIQYVKKLFGHPFIDLLGRKFQNEERIFS